MEEAIGRTAHFAAGSHPVAHVLSHYGSHSASPKDMGAKEFSALSSTMSEYQQQHLDPNANSWGQSKGP